MFDRTTARITRTLTSTTTHYTRRTAHNTTSVEVKLFDGDTHPLVIVESWRNSRPEAPYYSHRTRVSSRQAALAWVRQMLPLAIAL